MKKYPYIDKIKDFYRFKKCQKNKILIADCTIVLSSFRVKLFCYFVCSALIFYRKCLLKLIFVFYWHLCIDELFVSIRKGVNASEELMEYIYFSNKFIAPVKRAKCLYISNENEENNLHSFFERSWMYDYLDVTASSTYFKKIQ